MVGAHVGFPTNRQKLECPKEKNGPILLLKIKDYFYKSRGYLPRDLF
jgi:hypothetical protein